jgi:hypothetical protein
VFLLSWWTQKEGFELQGGGGKKIAFVEDDDDG